MKSRLRFGLRVCFVGLVALGAGLLIVTVGCPNPCRTSGTCVLLGGIAGCVNGSCARPTPGAALTASLELTRHTSEKLASMLPKNVYTNINEKLVGSGGASEALVKAQGALARNDLEEAVKRTLDALAVVNSAAEGVAGFNPCDSQQHIRRGEVLPVTVTSSSIGLLNFTSLRVAETANLFCTTSHSLAACQDIGQQISRVLALPPQLLAATEAPIHGYVGAVVPSGRELCVQVNVPDIQVWAEEAGTGKKFGNAKTNARGYFQLDRIPAGDYHVCVSGTGYQTTCDPLVTTVGNVTVVLDKPVPIYPSQTAVWGEVRLADKKTPCFTFRAAFDTLVQAKVKVLDSHNKDVGAPVNGNSLGQYVIPTPFVPGPLTVAANCEAATGSTPAIASPLPLNPYDVTVGNRPPAISSLELFKSGVIARRADPGSKIHAVSSASDPDGDVLQYKWVDESGRVLTFANSAAVDWPLLPGGARNTLHLQVSDGRGGYAFLRQSIVAGENLIYFSGRVFDRITGQPIANAQVTLNDQPTTTNSSGYFSISLADGGRFLLNVHAAGYALASRVLRRPGTLIEVPLDRMLAVQIDMRQGGTATFTPEERQGTLRSFSVTLPKGSLVDANNQRFDGMATVYGWPYDLNAPNPIPGDMGAIHNGKPVVLATWGAFDVRPTETTTGKPLRLAPGQQAPAALLIQSDRLATAPATIPFYSYDEKIGVWRDAGQLTRAANRYRGTIRHFSIFNADNQFGGSACVKVVLDPVTFPRPLVLFGHYDNPNLAPFAHNGTEINANDNTPVGILRLFPNQAFHLQVFKLGAQPSPLLASVPMNSGNALGANVALAKDAQGNPELGVPADQSWADCNDCQGRSPNDPNYVPCTIMGPQTVPPESIPTFLLPAFPVDNSAAYTSAVQNLGNCDRSTFTNWKTCNGFNQTPTNDDPLALPATEAHAYYFNNGDLKFGRDMHCRITSDGRTACYVTNYGDVGNDFTGGELHDAEKAINSVATVCMEYDPNATNGENVQFWAYQGQKAPQPDQPLPKPILDAQGAKPMPEMCLACHGGHYDTTTHKVRNGTFLPFDLTSFIYDENNLYNNNPSSSSFSLNLGNPFNAANPHHGDAQEQFRRLNNLVLSMNPDQLVGNTGLMPPSNYNTAPVAKLMTAWYSCGVATLGCQFNPSPPVPATSTNNTPFSGHESIYSDVVAKVCRTCHIAQNDAYPRTWTSYDQMKNNAFVIQLRACTTSPPNTINLSMPHAQVPFLQFWNDGLENILGAQVPLPGGVCRSP